MERSAGDKSPALDGEKGRVDCNGLQSVLDRPLLRNRCITTGFRLTPE